MKKFLLFFLCTMMMTQPVVAGSDSPSDWAMESVQLVTDFKLLDMTRVTDFHEPISRETYAYLIYQLYEHLSGGPIINGIPISQTGMVDDNRFTDTEDLTIRALKSAGLINGYPDGSFRPDQPISREEIMSLYVRLLEKLGYDLIPSEEFFADEDLISFWAKESVKKCYASRLILGVGDNKVAPKGEATVEESLVVMARILNHKSFGRVEPLEEGFFGTMVSDGLQTYGIRYNVFNEVVGIDLYEDYKLVKSVYTGSLVVEHLWLQDGVLFFKDSDHLIRALDRQGVISKASISLSDIDHLDTVGSKRYYLDERNHLMVEEQTTGEIFDYGKVNASKISVSWNYLVLEEIMVNGSKFTRVIPMFAIEDYL